MGLPTWYKQVTHIMCPKPDTSTEEAQVHSLPCTALRSPGHLVQANAPGVKKKKKTRELGLLHVYECPLPRGDTEDLGYISKEGPSTTRTWPGRPPCVLPALRVPAYAQNQAGNQEEPCSQQTRPFYTTETTGDTTKRGATPKSKQPRCLSARLRVWYLT